MDDPIDCDDLLHLLCPSPDRGSVETVIEAANASEVHGSRSQPILQQSNFAEVSSIELSKSDSALPPPHSLLGVSWRDASVGPCAHNTEDDFLTSSLLRSIVSPLGGNNNIDHSLITELLGPRDSITVGSEVFPATSLLAKDQQALQEVAASLPWEASSNDMVRCIPNGPVHVAAAAAVAPVGGHQSGGSSALASGMAVGMKTVGNTTQSGCTVQKMEFPPLLSGMKAAFGPCPVSLGMLQGSDHVVCGATEVGGRRGGTCTSNSVNLLPLPLQGEDKIALACKDKWKVCFNVGRKLIMEEAVPTSYRRKGFVPIARSLFGAPLDGHSAPFVLGTEFPDPNYCTARPTQFQKNMLVCGKMDLLQNRVIPLFNYSLSSTAGGSPVNLASMNIRVHALRLMTIPLVEHVRDMCWLRPPGGSQHTPLYIAAVAGTTLSILRWDTERDSVQVVADSCQLQNDTLRTVASRNELIAVGGFDGEVTLHDIAGVSSQLQTNFGHETSRGSSLLRYTLSGSGKGDGEDVVSCLQWQDEHTLGCTSDGGRMLLFDIRTPTPALDLATGRAGLFCHTFLNTDHVSFVMGFDGGIIEKMDMRMQVQPVLRFKDASVSAVSDIHLATDDSHMLVVGAHGFSLYEHTRDIQKQMGNLALKSHLRHSGPNCDMQHIFNGGFIPGTTTYALADTQGWLAADDWLRGAGPSVLLDRTNCGKGKVERSRRGCAITRRKCMTDHRHR